MKCTKQPGQGGRKCYWKDPALGVRTYADAKKADPNARYLWQNTRAGKAERAQKKVTQEAQLARIESGASAADNQVMAEVEVLDLDVEDGQKHEEVNGDDTNEGGELQSRMVSVEELSDDGDESEDNESGSESESDMKVTGVAPEAPKDEEMEDDTARL